MKIILDLKETTDIIHSCLCNALGWMRGYGLQVDISKEEYTRAKESMDSDKICYEDVLIKHIQNGNALRFKDSEGGGEYNAELTFETALENITDSENVAQYIIDHKEGRGDAITDDCILQTCLYGDIIFG